MTDISLSKIIRDYESDADFTWTDIEVGALITELREIAEAYHMHVEDCDAMQLRVEAMMERADLL